MIRTVNTGDAAAIAAIYNVYVATTTISFETEPVAVAEMERRIADISSRHPYMVWDEGGKVEGYCYAHMWKERAAYSHTLETTIYVASDCRGRGIGTRLMRALIDECRNAGAHALVACITGGNKASIELHSRLGFKQVSHFERVGSKFGKELDVTDMELLL